MKESNDDLYDRLHELLRGKKEPFDLERFKAGEVAEDEHKWLHYGGDLPNGHIIIKARIKGTDEWIAYNIRPALLGHLGYGVTMTTFCFGNDNPLKIVKDESE